MPFPLIVLSCYQSERLLAARRQGINTLLTSLDLEMSQAPVRLEDDGAVLPGGARLAWDSLEEIAAKPNACFVVEGGDIHPIQAFSEASGRFFSLYPTTSAPTMLISGIPMHRIKGTDPHRDTLAKVRAAAPLGGRVLDTTTGLGYTAIEAAHTASEVITVELDPAALAVARFNPWSQALFSTPNLHPVLGDSFDLIACFPEASFSVVVHDPPTYQLAGDLYSGEFYREAYRVLKPHGRLFHYVGDPESKMGATQTRGVVRRMEQAGFRRVVEKREAFGVTAYK